MKRRRLLVPLVLGTAACAKAGPDPTSVPVVVTATLPPVETSAPEPTPPAAPPVDTRVVACRRLGEVGDFFPAQAARGPAGAWVVAGHCSNSGADPVMGSATWAGFGEGGFVALVADGGAVRWARQLGGKDEDAMSVAASPGGDVAVGGTFAHDLDLGDLGGPKIATHDHGGAFALVADRSGKLRWSATFESAEASVKAVRFDVSGRLVLAGEVTGDITIGSKPLKGAAGVAGVFVAQLDASGHVAWARRFNGHGPARVSAMVVDAQGNALVSGTFEKDLALGKATLHTVDDGKGNAFLARIDGKGDVVWARSFDDAGKVAVRALAIGPKGEIFVAGAYWGALVLGNRLENAGGSDAFAAKLDAQGAGVWSTRLGGLLDDVASALAVDDTGDVTFAGTFTTKAALGDQTISGRGRNDLFVARLGPDGAPRWATPLARGDVDTSESTITSVTIDPAGDPVVVGWVNGSPQAGFPCGPAVLEARSNTTAFVAKLRR